MNKLATRSISIFGGLLGLVGCGHSPAEPSRPRAVDGIYPVSILLTRMGAQARLYQLLCAVGVLCCACDPVGDDDSVNVCGDVKDVCPANSVAKLEKDALGTCGADF